MTKNIPYYLSYMVSARIYPTIDFEFHKVKLLKFKDFGKNNKLY